LSSGESPQTWTLGDLGKFFVENRAQFLAHARRLTSTSVEAEEIVQDSLVRVLLACPELASREHALSYFHRVIKNLSIDLYRREGRQPRLVVLDDFLDDVEAQWSVEVDYAEEFAAADDAAMVREAISLLSAAERAALVMWEVEGRSTAEIARELGLKESTVRHTVSRARARLRKILAERILDEERGLTALDLLSATYRKARKVVEKSSRVALSLCLVFSAFAGFNSLMSGDFEANENLISLEESIEERESTLSPPNVKNGETSHLDEVISRETLGDSGSIESMKNPSSRTSSAISVNSTFLGLDESGLPTGFSVSDSLGNFGVLFLGRSNVTNTETGLLHSGIISTKSGATNVLINQSIVVDAFGTSYIGEVSVGINGGWRPLSLSYISSDVERLASGNYLLTAIMMVDSALETFVKVPTGTSGTDLSSAPNFISTRVMLDPTKTKVLAQAVFVSADSQGDGA